MNRCISHAPAGGFAAAAGAALLLAAAFASAGAGARASPAGPGAGFSAGGGAAAFAAGLRRYMTSSVSAAYTTGRGPPGLGFVIRLRLAAAAARVRY